MTTQFIINHLWQSSCFVLLTGLLAFALRKNSPKVRYWIWLSASLKFLVPFALLASLGTMIPRPTRNPASAVAPVFRDALVQIADPFSPASNATVPAHPPVLWAPTAIGVIWALGFLAIALARCRGWIAVRAGLRAGVPIELPIPVRALITPGAEEPCIAGFLRPVLVLPAQLLEHLNAQQLCAILTHEMCHVRRRDNFFAAVHMAVEAIFWFHPLVWWIGSRMVEERELACDEEVLRMGCEPADYVEGILKVCRFYAESPLPCVSGVTGANVKRRLRAILAGGMARELTVGKKVVLAVLGLATVAVPIVVGVLNAPFVRAQSRAQPRPVSVNPVAARPVIAPEIVAQQGGAPQGVRQGTQPDAVPLPSDAKLTFEVASMRYAPTPPGGVSATRQGGPGTADPERLTYRNVPLKNILMSAYGMKDFQISSPGWMETERYDISATIPPGTGQEQFNIMLQNLVTERLQMTVHHEKKDFSAYALVVGKNGLKMKESDISVAPPPPLADGRAFPKSGNDGFPQLPSGRPNMVGSETYGHNRFTAVMVAMPGLAIFLENQIGRPVSDETGLTGRYDFKLDFSKDGLMGLMALSGPQPRPGPNDDPSDTGPTIFQAIQDRLGLKLEEKKVPFDVLVIDRAEKMPAEN